MSGAKGDSVSTNVPSTSTFMPPIEMESRASVRHTRLTEGDTIHPDGKIPCCGYVLMVLSFLFCVLTFPFCLCYTLKVVQQYERGVMFKLGRVVSRCRGPGLCFVLPFVENIIKVDLRLFTYSIPPQEILTKDCVTVLVDAVIYARIYDANMATVNIMDAKRSTYLLGATTLRNTMGTVILSEILSEREKLAANMQTHLDGATQSWGVKVERVEVKDVRLPMQMQRAMAAEAEATREARARVISAEGELRASKSLKGAADVMSEAPASLQLRYLQTLHTVSEEKNHTIVLPFPPNIRDLWSRESTEPLPASRGAERAPLLETSASVDTTF